jgi:hypothetical protein
MYGRTVPTITHLHNYGKEDVACASRADFVYLFPAFQSDHDVTPASYDALI